jgi:hypothetical protein
MPGFGLLMLRATAGVALVASGVIHLVRWQQVGVMTIVPATFSLICGFLLLLGLFNWLACILSALIGLGVALALIPVPLLNPSWPRIPAVFTAAIAIAVLCLGPGAYSLDARRHGHREIIIPARPPGLDDSSA